jgi:hypothetical protein
MLILLDLFVCACLCFISTCYLLTYLYTRTQKQTIREDKTKVEFPLDQAELDGKQYKTWLAYPLVINMATRKNPCKIPHPWKMFHGI